MAYPYIFHANFEAALSGEWDVSESDTGGLLDRVHYADLAPLYSAAKTAMPFRGAYCMRIDGRPFDTNDHTVGDGDIDIATGVTRYFRFYLYVSTDFSSTADDNFSIFELQQAGGTQELVLGMRVQEATDTVNLWVAVDNTPNTHGAAIQKGKWLCIELTANCDTAAANSDLIVYINSVLYVQLSAAVQNAGAIGQGILGTQVTAATTTGTLLFDHFTMDDARLYPLVERFPQTVPLIKTGHVFVGPGTVDSAVILSANGTLDLYDTDVANVNDAFSRLVELDTANYSTFEGPVSFKRGCYAVVGGTNPRCEVKLNSAGKGAMAYGGDGAIRNWAAKRAPHPLGV